MSRLLVVGHSATTLAMVGLMWTVQVVVYPQFRHVDGDSFADFAGHHANRMVAALAVFAPAEIGFAAWLWIDTPDPLSRTLVFVAGCLLALGWVSTAVWFAPLHGRLQHGLQPALVDRLISTNWIRTALWVTRGAFACIFLWQVLETSG